MMTVKDVRKSKKSFTLSEDAVAFLEALRKEEHARSTSNVLESIVLEARRIHDLRVVENATIDYYSSLSEQEAKEQAAWGDFALKQSSGEAV